MIPVPWSDDVVDTLARFQMSHGKFYYLCGNPLHGADRPRLVPTKGGWVCVTSLDRDDECFYLQQWAYESSLI